MSQPPKTSAPRTGSTPAAGAPARPFLRIGVRALVPPMAAVVLLWPALTSGTSIPKPQQDAGALPQRPASSLISPDERTIPAGRMGDVIRYGQKVLTNTQTYAKQYVGNGLNCTSCHLNGGRTAYSAPWVGVWGVFPEYRSRNDAMNALQDRVNDCFERSMNGKALPANSDEMYGILAYMWWLSKDVPTGVSVVGRGLQRIRAESTPDPGRGKEIYAAKCVACHMPNGEGMRKPNGEYLFPPLWGPESFNIGAGMARLSNAAAFVKANMPIGQEDTLTVQEAFDVAAYFTQQPRPDFPGKERDWPKGDKPKDARY